VKSKSEIRDIYLAIKKLTTKHSITLLCSIGKVSRSGYYKWLKRREFSSNKQLSDIDLQKKIMECHLKLKGIYGYYRITAWLKRTYGIVVNHKRVYRLMKLMGIQARIRKKKPYFGKREASVISSNILNRDFKSNEPNKKWVTDITYLMFNNQRLYLSVILDLFNREVVSYQISEHCSVKLVLDTVNAATKNKNVNGILLHSDQGHQYTSRAYNTFLRSKNIRPSMSRKGNCLDNACIENFFGHLKSELMYINKFKTKDEVIQAVNEYMYFYNNERFQAKLKNRSPIEYRTTVCA